MSSLLPLMAQDGSIRAPQTLKLGTLTYEDTIRIAWGMNSILKKLSLEKVKFMQSRSPKPQNVRHRILVGGLERYSFHVNMKTGSVSFEGPFVFRTPSGASRFLHDYAFPIATGRVWRSIKPASPVSSSEVKASLPEWKVGSFLEIQGDRNPNWIARVIDNTETGLGVYHMKETSKGSNLYRQSNRSWIINRDVVVKELEPLTELEKGVWIKGTVLAVEPSLVITNPPPETVTSISPEQPSVTKQIYGVDANLTPTNTLPEWKAGSFLEVQNKKNGPQTIGMVAKDSNRLNLEIYLMQERRRGPNLYRKSQGSYTVRPKFVVKKIDPLQEVRKGVWLKTTVLQDQTNKPQSITPPEAKDLTTMDLVQQTTVPAPVVTANPPKETTSRPIPDLEENPRKRVESELRFMQEHTKRLRMSLETLEKATFDLAFQWNVPLVQ